MAGVGAQLFQPPVTLINTMNGITQKHFAPVLADSIFKPSPTWWRVTRLGRKVTGGALVWNVVTIEETTGGAYFEIGRASCRERVEIAEGVRTVSRRDMG